MRDWKQQWWGGGGGKDHSASCGTERGHTALHLNLVSGVKLSSAGQALTRVVKVNKRDGSYYTCVALTWRGACDKTCSLIAALNSPLFLNGVSLGMPQSSASNWYTEGVKRRERIGSVVELVLAIKWSICHHLTCCNKPIGACLFWRWMLYSSLICGGSSVPTHTVYL